jgi:hypothetical protein
MHDFINFSVTLKKYIHLLLTNDNHKNIHLWCHQAINAASCMPATLQLQPAHAGNDDNGRNGRKRTYDIEKRKFSVRDIFTFCN